MPARMSKEWNPDHARDHLALAVGGVARTEAPGERVDTRDAWLLESEREALRDDLAAAFGARQ